MVASGLRVLWAERNLRRHPRAFLPFQETLYILRFLPLDHLHIVTLMYIDPGSGSYLVQVIIAAVLGVLFYFKNLWLKARSFFFKEKKDNPPEHDE